MKFSLIQAQAIRRCDAIRLACEWEVRAPKLGNVHPQAPFVDCDYNDFMRAAIAIAPLLGSEDRSISLGDRILSAVKATRAVARSNVNLGIILLLAPLAMADDAESVKHCVESITPDDGQKIFAAIQLATPGGMKRSDVAPQHDVQTTSPEAVNLHAAMQSAAHRDRIALQYASGFQDFFSCVLPLMSVEIKGKPDLESAIVNAQIRLMAERSDCLIARKCGDEIAAEAQRRAAECLKQNSASSRAQLDAWLRADGNRRNPGTTADFLAAALYWLLYHPSYT